MAPRYFFGELVLSPASRVLTRNGQEIPLISRYLDLLILLVQCRQRAVTRQEILDTVWSDVVVSDGALTQAVRTLRRALGDDPRDPTFIRTIPRYGYQLICCDVVEAPDDEPLELGRAAHTGDQGEASGRIPSQTSDARSGTTRDAQASPAGPDPFEQALARLLEPETAPEDDDENGNGIRAREAAIQLHQLGIDQALERLDRRPGHARARALLRDVRWDLATASPVPLLGQPAPVRTLVELIRLRLGQALRLIERRWARAAAGGAIAGFAAGLAGAAALLLGPGTSAGAGIFVTLAVVGVVIGGLGAVGVGAGMAAAEAAVRSSRCLALVGGGALGGLAIGTITHVLGRLTLEGLVGGDLSAVAGGWEGLVLGGAAGLGYGLTTRPPGGGMATPHGLARLRTAALTGLVTAAAAIALTSTGSLLAAQSLDLLARTFPDSQVGLAPVARLFGEPTPGPVARIVIASWEGFLFGLGLVLGLTHRPRHPSRMS